MRPQESGRSYEMTNEELKALRTQIAKLQRQLAMELRARKRARRAANRSLSNSPSQAD